MVPKYKSVLISFLENQKTGNALPNSHMATIQTGPSSSSVALILASLVLDRSLPDPADPCLNLLVCHSLNMLRTCYDATPTA